MKVDSIPNIGSMNNLKVLKESELQSSEMKDAIELLKGVNGIDILDHCSIVYMSGNICLAYYDYYYDPKHYKIKVFIMSLKHCFICNVTGLRYDEIKSNSDVITYGLTRTFRRAHDSKYKHKFRFIPYR